MKRLVGVFFLCVMGLFRNNCLFANGNFFSWDFSMCELEEIIYAVSLDTGLSIVADDTVKGKASFKFAGHDFEKAFESFLESERLYAEKKDGIWFVSRFRFIQEDGVYMLDAYDLFPWQIIEKLSQRMETSITFDTLPSNSINIHLKGNSEIEILRKIEKFFYGIELIEENNSVHFRKKTSSLRSEDYIEDTCVFLERDDGSYYVDVKNVKVNEALEKFFETAKEKGSEYKYCFLVAAEGKIARSSFTARDFDDCLMKLCNQNGLKAINKDGIFYITNDSGIKKKLISEKVDWYKIELNHIKASDFIEVINKRFGKIENIVLKNESSLLIKVSEFVYGEINKIIKDIDIEVNNYVIELKYIKGEDALKFIPASVDKSKLYIADDNSSIFFTGSEGEYRNIKKQIELCDKPIQRISYDLLILQYDENENFDWSNSFNANRLTYGNYNNCVLQLGDVLGLNMNVLSVFGFEFAMKLQSALEKNSTKVFADTTLHGVSGKKINFENTNIYRYRDNNLDPETGKPIYSGVTREISSGLKLEISGWVSGDGMITSTVTASIGRQGIDTSAYTGNPPPTSEKIVTTEVCGKSGEPIILSGLIQNAESLSERKVPLLSKIPFLGWLFKSFDKTSEKTQMIIYLVPRVQEYGDSIVEEATNHSIKAKEKNKQLIEYIKSEVKNGKE